MGAGVCRCDPGWRKGWAERHEARRSAQEGRARRALWRRPPRHARGGSCGCEGRVAAQTRTRVGEDLVLLRVHTDQQRRDRVAVLCRDRRHRLRERLGVGAHVDAADDVPRAGRGRGVGGGERLLGRAVLGGGGGGALRLEDAAREGVDLLADCRLGRRGDHGHVHLRGAQEACVHGSATSRVSCGQSFRRPGARAGAPQRPHAKRGRPGRQQVAPRIGLKIAPRSRSDHKRLPDRTRPLSSLTRFSNSGAPSAIRPAALTSAASRSPSAMAALASDAV